MTINELRDNVATRLAVKGFHVSDISNAGGFDKNDLFKIELETWNNPKYEFHYEVQKSNKNGIFELRIDCHFKPYQPYESGRHSDAEHEQLINILEQIADGTVDVMPSIRVERKFDKKSLWGVKWKLDNDVCLEQIICIINETTQLISKLAKS